VHQFYEDSVANGLKVLAPDINSGEYRFVPWDASTIRYGLGAVKGTGESAITTILAARKDGPFRDLFDFCERVDKRTVNRRVVEALVRAGAFDGVNAGDHSARASLLASVGIALEAAEQTERNARQVSLFGPGEGGFAAEAGARRCAAVGRGAAPARGKGEPRVLSLGAPFYRVPRRDRALRPDEPAQPRGLGGGRGADAARS